MSEEKQKTAAELEEREKKAQQLEEEKKQLQQKTSHLEGDLMVRACVCVSSMPVCLCVCNNKRDNRNQGQWQLKELMFKVNTLSPMRGPCLAHYPRQHKTNTQPNHQIFTHPKFSEPRGKHNSIQ